MRKLMNLRRIAGIVTVLVALQVIGAAQSTDWVRTLYVTGTLEADAQGLATAIDDSGNVYMGGRFKNYAVGENTTLYAVNSGSTACVIAKYSSDGTMLWSKLTSPSCYVQDMKYHDGDLYVSIQCFTNFPPDTFHFDTLSYAKTRQSALFLFKLNAYTGDVIWWKPFETLGIYFQTETLGAIEVYQDKVFIAGSYNSAIYFDSDSLLSSDFGSTPNKLYRGYFLMSLDSNGSVNWRMTSNVDTNIAQFSPASYYRPSMCISPLGVLYFHFPFYRGDFGGSNISLYYSSTFQAGRHNVVARVSSIGTVNGISEIHSSFSIVPRGIEFFGNKLIAYGDAVSSTPSGTVSQGAQSISVYGMTGGGVYVMGLNTGGSLQSFDVSKGSGGVYGSSWCSGAIGAKYDNRLLLGMNFQLQYNFVNLSRVANISTLNRPSILCYNADSSNFDWDVELPSKRKFIFGIKKFGRQQ
ncbi:MAG: hypothetical protein R2813_04515 [Flavobacteriales bacterium]